MTLRLYYSDAYLRTFEANILRGWPQEKHYAVVLDQTGFYPTSGGQPHDVGTLEGIPVIDVYEEQGDIVHVLEQKLTPGPVRGEIDWARRFDHMQQHTGQHILSQAFLSRTDAETVSFHLGENSSTIDLDCHQLTPDQAAGVEDLANKIVMQNRAVSTRSVSQEEAATIGLRKPPAVNGIVRVIEVEGFDLSACGGTHVRSSGEIGSISIRRWELRRNKIRVEFLCGWRALRDHRQKNAVVLRLAQDFSVGEWELEEAVKRLRAEAQTCHSTLKRLREQALDHEAEVLYSKAPVHGGYRVVARAFKNRNPDEVRLLAIRLAHKEQTVALLGCANDVGRIFFARSEDLSMNMKELLQETCQSIGKGGGGGTPSMAQGGGLPAHTVEQALTLASNTIVSVA